jgi:ATP-binding cassette subfamily B protein
MHLKGHLGELALIFVLLIGQAVCDLALPTFTSVIVDVGIQQGGIEDSAPSELTEASYDGLSVLLSGDDLTFTADKTSGTVATKVVNKPGTLLPETGGIGTTIFYVLGGVMMAGAVVLMVTKRRMNAER